MHKIVRRLSFCYGHRLLDHEGKCSRPHGHNAVVEVEVSTDRLDERGMVCDFGEVKSRLMEFIDAELDHRMILHRNDPLVAALEGTGDRPLVLEENPTAENLARLIFRKARALEMPVVSVRLWETENCYAEYSDRPPGES